MKSSFVSCLTVLTAAAVGAQTPSGAPAAAAGNAVPPADQQIAAAVLPLPADLRNVPWLLNVPTGLVVKSRSASD